MATITNLQQVFDQELKETFDAEEQLIEALGRMAANSASLTLKKAFNDHLAETKDQVSRLEQIGSALNSNLRGKECQVMKTLIANVSEIIDQTIEDGALKDILLIAAAQKIEHYEISSYGTLCALAQNLELNSAVDVLQDSLDQEYVIDELLTEIAKDEIFGSVKISGGKRGLGEQQSFNEDSDWNLSNTNLDISPSAETKSRQQG